MATSQESESESESPGARSGSRSRSRNSTTTTSKLWQTSGVGDKVARSHGNESGVGVGVEFGATTTPQLCFFPYDILITHRMLLTIRGFLPSASYHPLLTKRRVGTPREMNICRDLQLPTLCSSLHLHGGFCAQMVSLLLGSPHAELNKDLFCQK